MITGAPAVSAPPSLPCSTGAHGVARRPAPGGHGNAAKSGESSSTNVGRSCRSRETRRPGSRRCRSSLRRTSTSVAWARKSQWAPWKGLPFDGVLRFGFPRPGLTPCTWLTGMSRDDPIERAGVLPSAKISEIEDAFHLTGQAREWTPRDVQRDEECPPSWWTRRRRKRNGRPRWCGPSSPDDKRWPTVSAAPLTSKVTIYGWSTGVWALWRRCDPGDVRGLLDRSDSAQCAGGHAAAVDRSPDISSGHRSHGLRSARLTTRHDPTSAACGGHTARRGDRCLGRHITRSRNQAYSTHFRSNFDNIHHT